MGGVREGGRGRRETEEGIARCLQTEREEADLI